MPHRLPLRRISAWSVIHGSFLTGVLHASVSVCYTFFNSVTHIKSTMLHLLHLLQRLWQTIMCGRVRVYVRVYIYFLL